MGRVQGWGLGRAERAGPSAQSMPSAGFWPAAPPLPASTGWWLRWQVSAGRQWLVTTRQPFTSSPLPAVPVTLLPCCSSIFPSPVRCREPAPCLTILLTSPPAGGLLPPHCLSLGWRPERAPDPLAGRSRAWCVPKPPHSAATRKLLCLSAVCRAGAEPSSNRLVKAYRSVL